MNKKIAFKIFHILLLILAGGCRKSDIRDIPTSVSYELRTMGTTMHITLCSTTMDKQELKKCSDEAFKEVRRIEKLMNLWDKDSEINRINSAKTGEWTTVDNATFKLIEKAIKASEITDGAFDITVNPLVNLWGFGSKSKEIHETPAENEIMTALVKTGYKKIILNKEKTAVSFTQDGVTIDLSGIAKGYGVDVAINALRECGVRQAMVEIGGEVRVLGKNKNNDKWRIGIRHPLKEKELLGVIEMEDESVATSGDYENYFEIGGVRYSHIINPLTGKPSTSGIAGVTIISRECADADALATGLMVMPFDKGCRLLENLTDYEGIIIKRITDEKLEIFVTDGLKGKVEIADCLEQK